MLGENSNNRTSGKDLFVKLLIPFANAQTRGIARYLYPYRMTQAAVIALEAAALPFALAIPLVTKFVIDGVFTRKDVKAFLLFSCIGAGAFIINGILQFFADYLSGLLTSKVRFDLTRDVFTRLQFRDMRFFSRHSTGEHIYKVSSDVEQAVFFVCKSFPQTVKLYPRFIVTLGIVIWLNWRLALLACFMFPAGYLCPYFFGKRMREVMRNTIAQAQDFFKEAQEVFSHMPAVKAFNRGGFHVEQATKVLLLRRDYEIANARYFGLNNLFSSFFNKLLGGIVALCGGYMVLRGRMTLGSLSAVMIYMTQLIRFSVSLGQLHQDTLVRSVSCGRLAEILEAPAETESENTKSKAVTVKGDIEFRDVRFSYEEGGRRIIDGLSFRIPAGEKAALAGPSGCGKTTILSLIMKLYEPQEGAVLIDGVEIRDISPGSLRGVMGVAFQEPFLWNDSIRANILYGKPGAGEEEMLWAARVAGADGFIREFPRGYDTEIGEMACRISEGQKQRIALARAVIRRPGILLMDECLSCVDSAIEERIIANLKNELPGSTVMLVSHRLSAVKQMGEVYFLNDSRSVAVGSHESLLLREPGYKTFLSAQYVNLQR